MRHASPVGKESREQARRRERSEQAAAASELQEATRKRRALEETFLKYNGTEVSQPKWGHRGAREVVPAMLVCGDELLDAIKEEEAALEAFRRSVR